MRVTKREGGAVRFDGMGRALLAFLALPGMVTGVVPLLLMMLPASGWFQSWYFLISVGLGLLVLVRCVASFYRRGKGTLAPWDPPKRLVVEDLYQYNRNPMYVGVALILIGWAGVLGSAWHYLYALVVPTIFHLRVVFYEERELEKRFPEDWADYKKNVPRWLFNVRPYQPFRHPPD